MAGAQCVFNPVAYRLQLFAVTNNCSKIYLCDIEFYQIVSEIFGGFYFLYRGLTRIESGLARRLNS
ncbi:MAG: hypothetical protein A3B04_03430 [Candidatus Portnoybacteria bacterium RIFCSPLOWO2_02_FULL_39_11]|uniref:Uncharacterized protein n=1 Tax=Candidatus Portnoybacteria bacterium RIFCSPLOWO2_02_FULL_39_11 TaxID=1802001 RepID=A0A1G2FUY3_9BACT|nr:MAG: hypothetical protein A3B04_03430 [Candidatus Portnoybacteria bacterium RIFCSPLOWO2_02_FULL_39_11]